MNESKTSLILNKHRIAFSEIRNTMENFCDEFNIHFYEQIFKRFTEKLQNLMDEKYTKYIEVSKNYHTQIKEMEFLITGGIKIKSN
jgi:hypothetical protein